MGVATLEAYRGRGLIGELIHYIQIEAGKRELENLWVFPINENIEKVYQKYGFQTLETLKTGHAFLGGKSIEEIRRGVLLSKSRAAEIVSSAATLY